MYIWNILLRLPWAVRVQRQPFMVCSNYHAINTYLSWAGCVLIGGMCIMGGILQWHIVMSRDMHHVNIFNHVWFEKTCFDGDMFGNNSYFSSIQEYIVCQMKHSSHICKAITALHILFYIYVQLQVPSYCRGQRGRCFLTRRPYDWWVSNITQVWNYTMIDIQS